jgi:hypothetical protein
MLGVDQHLPERSFIIKGEDPEGHRAGPRRQHRTLFGGWCGAEQLSDHVMGIAEMNPEHRRLAGIDLEGHRAALDDLPHLGVGKEGPFARQCHGEVEIASTAPQNLAEDCVRLSPVTDEVRGRFKIEGSFDPTRPQRDRATKGHVGRLVLAEVEVSPADLGAHDVLGLGVELCPDKRAEELQRLLEPVTGPQLGRPGDGRRHVLGARDRRGQTQDKEERPPHPGNTTTSSPPHHGTYTTTDLGDHRPLEHVSLLTPGPGPRAGRVGGPGAARSGYNPVVAESEHGLVIEAPPGDLDRKVLDALSDGLKGCPDLAFAYLARVIVTGMDAPPPSTVLFAWLNPSVLRSLTSALNLVSEVVARALPQGDFLDVVILNSAPELLESVNAAGNLLVVRDREEHGRALDASCYEPPEPSEKGPWWRLF